MQRLQNFWVQTPRESLSQFVLIHTISLYSHGLSVDIVSCKILSQSVTEVWGLIVLITMSKRHSYLEVIPCMSVLANLRIEKQCCEKRIYSRKFLRL